jgi:hypothetical protein
MTILSTRCSVRKRRLYADLMRRPSGVAVALAFLLAAAAACGGSGGDSSASGASPRPREKRDTGPGCQYIVASDGKRFRRPGKNLMYLTDAVAEPAVCYDKITFVFDTGEGPGLPPGYVVEYRKPPFVPGINTTTEGFKEAKAYLYVETQPTATVDRRFAGSGRTTYRGNQRLALEGMHHTVIVEWVKAYEDQTPDDPTDDKVIWVIGLDEKRPFTVDSANQPTPHVSVLVMR